MASTTGLWSHTFTLLLLCFSLNGAQAATPQQTLFNAVQNGDSGGVKAALLAGAKVNAKDADGWTALIYAAHAGHLDIVNTLIDAGADLNAASKTGDTALMAAAINGNPAIVKRLLDKGAKRDAKNKAGHNAADFAHKKGHAQLAALLRGEKTSALPTVPIGDASKIVLPNGLTLHDWTSLAPSRLDKGETEAILQEGGNYLRQHGPHKNLMAVLDKAIAAFTDKIVIETRQGAAAVLPKLQQYTQQLGDWPQLLHKLGYAQHALGNFEHAQAAYTKWLTLAPVDHPQRQQVVNWQLMVNSKKPAVTDALLAIIRDDHVFHTTIDNVLLTEKNGALHIWDLGDAKPLKILNHTRYVRLIGQDKVLTVNTEDASIRIWHPISGAGIELKGHTAAPDSFAVAGNRLVSSNKSNYDKSLRLWDINTGELIKTFILEPVSYSIADSIVIAGDRILVGANNTLRILDINKGTLLHSIPVHDYHHFIMAASKDGRVVTAAWDHTVKIWSIDSGELIREDKLDSLPQSIRIVGEYCLVKISYEPIVTCALSKRSFKKPFRNFIVRNNQLHIFDDAQIQIVDSTTGNTIHTLDDKRTIGQYAASDTLGVTSAYTKTVHVWNLATGTLLHTLSGHSDTVERFLLTDKYLVTATKDRIIHVWDNATGSLLKTLQGHLDEIDTLQVAKNRLISRSSKDKSIRIWALPE